MTCKLIVLTITFHSLPRDLHVTTEEANVGLTVGLRYAEYRAKETVEKLTGDQVTGKH